MQKWLAGMVGFEPTVGHCWGGLALVRGGASGGESRSIATGGLGASASEGVGAKRWPLVEVGGGVVSVSGAQNHRKGLNMPQANSSTLRVPSI